MTGAKGQADWVVAAAARRPVAEDELREHMTWQLLDVCGGPDGFNAGFTGLARLTIDRMVVAQPDLVQAAVRSGAERYLLTVHVDPDGLMDGLRLTADPAPPGSWADLDGPTAALGNRVSFVASEIDPNGALDVIQGVDADVLRPVGSAFKLYVLGALAQAVLDGRASWDEPLATRDDWKSLPSGRLQDLPAGDELTLAEFAAHMISRSDNTATDHLIHRLGRDAVQKQLALFRHSRPAATVPFLTSRAMFRLRTDRYPTLAEEYLALPTEQERTAAVEVMEGLPLVGVAEVWSSPRMVDEIEWFASPIDIGHAIAGLQHLGGPEIHQAMSLDDGGLNLDMSRFPIPWFKGGSEPGVVTLNFLARTDDCRALVVSLMVSDPDDAPVTLEVAEHGLAVVRSAFHLLDIND